MKTVVFYNSFLLLQFSEELLHPMLRRLKGVDAPGLLEQSQRSGSSRRATGRQMQ
jgi:hypothetical protein